MLLMELLPAEHIVVPLEAGSFRAAVQQIADRLAEAGAVRNRADLQHVLAHARGRDVVAIGEHVALPHFRTDAVDRLVMGLGVARSALDVSDTALSTSPRIIVLVLAPPEAATRYLQTVAALARLLRDESVVQRIGAANSAADLLALPELSATRVEPNLRVRDIMAHRTEGVSADATVREAVDTMLRHGWRALAVLGEKGEVRGIITEWDVMRALLPEIPTAGAPAGSEPPEQALRVRDVMTRSVLCVPEDLGLEEAAHMMINKNVEQFPVVNESGLTGMLSRSDIIRKLFKR